MIVFDLDGTLADCWHRKHLVEAPEDDENFKVYYSPSDELNCRRENAKYIHKETGELWKADWKSFYEACNEDKPIKPTIKIIQQFLCADGMDERFDIRIWSGRCESVREKTLIWLQDNIDIYGHDTYFFDAILKMRPIGDSTPDDQLKERWLDDHLARSGKVDFVFDDRKKVIDMWIRRGIFVFDVSQGKGNF